MKKSLFLSTLTAAAAMAVPAFATNVDFSNNDSFTIDPSSYTAEDTLTFGDSTGSFVNGGTFAADIVINKGTNENGLTISSGTAAEYTFSGTITGSGDWTTSSSVANNYTFTGNISGWTGTLIGPGTATFESTSSDTVEINANLNIEKMVFAGTANYVVNGTVIGYLHSGTQDNTITISTTGSVTFNTTTEMTEIGVFTVNTGSTVIFGNSVQLDLSGDNAAYGLFVDGTLEVAGGATLTISKKANATVSVANLKLDSGSTFSISDNAANTISLGSITVGGGSATITDNYYACFTIGALAGSGTLTLSSSAADTHATIYELKGTSDSSFSGTITLSDTNGSNSDRGVTLIISSEKAAAGAVIEMGTEKSTDTLALGVNASRVEIAGLMNSATGNEGADIIYSGYVSLDVRLGNAGHTFSSGASNYTGILDGAGSGDFEHVGTSRNTLVINSTGDYSFHGVFMNMLNLEKSGTGKQSISFDTDSSFDGSIAVKAGTLALSGTAISSTGITVESGATLTIGNEITLATTNDVSEVSSKISGAVTITGTLNVGDSTMTLDTTLGTSTAGTVTFTEGAQLILTDAFLASASTTDDAITIIMASSITYDSSAISDDLDTFVSNVIFWSDSYELSNWTYTDGVLSATVTYLPEPSMFGLMFGLGAIGLVATRRRRRA